MILVEGLKKVLDECEDFWFGDFVVTSVDKSTCVTKAARIQFTICDDLYIDVYDDWVTIDKKCAIVYSRFTAPTANLITNYLIENLDKWWKE